VNAYKEQRLQGDQVFEGTQEVEALVLAAVRSDYTVMNASPDSQIPGGDGQAGIFTITDAVEGRNGQIVVDSYERFYFYQLPNQAAQMAGESLLQFEYAGKALDIGGASGNLFRTYTTTLGREADESGFGFWLKGLDAGAELSRIVNDFLSSPEFTALHGALDSLSDSDFLTLLYDQALNRAPDVGGFDFWMDALESGARRDEVATGFVVAQENIVDTYSSIANGIDYLVWDSV
jgi:hypothetical protein